MTGEITMNKPSVPERFKIKIGGLSGPSYSVRLKGDDLLYTSWDNDNILDERRITPIPDTWQAFRHALDDIGVWNWQEAYPNPGETDSTQWSLDIAWDGREITSSGDGNYPVADGRPDNDPDITPTFERFLEAVRKLIGRPEFR